MNLLKYLEAEADKLHEENFSSSDEFRTVNNSFVEGFNYALAIVQGHEIKLNENQQVVLDTLKDDSLGYSPFFTIWHTMENNQLFNGKEMPVRQQFEVLAAFAEWGLSHAEE